MFCREKFWGVSWHLKGNISTSIQCSWQILLRTIPLAHCPGFLFHIRSSPFVSRFRKIENANIKTANDKRKLSKRFSRQTDTQWYGHHLSAWPSPAVPPGEDALSVSSGHLSQSLLLHFGSQERLEDRSPPFWTFVLHYVADLTIRKGRAWSQEALKPQLKKDIWYVPILINQMSPLWREP